MDVVGTVYAYTAAWGYRRIDPVAARWLTPLRVWMPVTTLLKLLSL